MLNGWYRAQIMAVFDGTDECDIKYVDYGGYSRISSQCLKQIRLVYQMMSRSKIFSDLVARFAQA